MEKEDLSNIMRQHPFLAGLSAENMQTLIGCASNVRFSEGMQIIREGEVANTFYLVRAGRVALEIELPGRGHIRVQTVGPGEILGWSWLIYPYRWHFSAVAVAETRTIALDGECLRRKCESDAQFGYEMLKRLAVVMEERLDATQMQLLDMYGTPPTGVRA